MSIRLNEGLRVEPVPACALCGTEGRPLYTGLRDRLFDAPGIWNLSRCPPCGLVWLNPRPIADELLKVYVNYHTHTAERPVPTPLLSGMRRFRRKLKEAVLATAFRYPELSDGWGLRLLGRLASLVPPVKNRVGATVMSLPGFTRGKLVDVGCGSGGFLAAMRKLGWEVQGIEPDPEAARLAQQVHGVPVTVGTLESAHLPAASVDAITMRHVLEHVYEPLGLLCECYRVLRPGGRLVSITPNIESLGHKVFQRAWRGLETPRHFYLFSLRTLDACARQTGFGIQSLRTGGLGSRYIWAQSQMIREREAFRDGQPGDWLALAQAIWRTPWQAAGEELVLIATKPAGLKRACA